MRPGKPPAAANGFDSRNPLEPVILGPTSEDYSDPDAVQETFVQQRGLERNRLGVTGDVRDLIKDGKLDPPEQPAEVSKRGDPKPLKSTFYDES